MGDTYDAGGMTYGQSFRITYDSTIEVSDMTDSQTFKDPVASAIASTNWAGGMEYGQRFKQRQYRRKVKVGVNSNQSYRL